MVIVGVLALQGAFKKHIDALTLLGVTAIEVRTPKDLAKCHGLIIPGGESTTMMKQIDFIELREPLLLFASEKPVFGTCAGLILMSKEIIGPLILETAVQGNEVMQGFELESLAVGVDHSQKVKATPTGSDYGLKNHVNLLPSTAVSRLIKPFNLFDVKVERNAFGRQVESFETTVEASLHTIKSIPIDAVFIRAPRIRGVGEKVKVLARYNEEPVLVQQGLHLGASFHPELTADLSLHRYFLEMIVNSL